MEDSSGNGNSLMEKFATKKGEKYWVPRFYPGTLIPQGAIREAWDAIPQEDIDNLIKSMDTRVEAVRQATGWQTRF